MMHTEKHMTKKEFAQSLGFNVRTLYRRLKALNIQTKRGELLCPALQKYIRDQLDAYGLCNS